jgi:hypothetical protein
VVWVVDARGAPAAAVGSALFNLDIDLGAGGAPARLRVLQGAALSALAADFAAEHRLPPSALRRLAALLEASTRTHQAAASGGEVGGG